MKFDLTGYNIDNLLKTLYIRKVTLLNVVRHEHNKVSFEILDRDFKKVKRHIANFKVKQTMSRFKRFPSYILANVGVIIGCFIGLIFGLFASQYTWQIKVYGMEELTENDIISVLSENNIKKGKINSQTSEEIEEILLNNYDRIAQVSVIREGTAIIINLSEKLVYNEVEFQPITAKYSGVIKSINIITGTANVKVGDYVNTGDVLVLPFNLNSKEQKVSVKPIAKITAEIFVVAKCEMKKIEQVLVRTGRTQKVYNYKLKNKKIFSGKSKNSFALFELVVYNENISDLIPLNRDKLVYYELKTQEVERDFKMEEQKLKEESVQKAYSNLPNGEILSEKSRVSIVEDTMFAITTITVYGEIV